MPPIKAQFLERILNESIGIQGYVSLMMEVEEIMEFLDLSTFEQVTPMFRYKSEMNCPNSPRRQLYVSFGQEARNESVILTIQIRNNLIET